MLVKHDTPPILAMPGALRYDRSTLAEPEEQAVAITCGLLDEMADRCAQRDCRLAVVIAPSIWEVRDDLRAPNKT